MTYIAFFDPSDLTIRFNLEAIHASVWDGINKVLDDKEIESAHAIVKNVFLTKNGIDLQLRNLMQGRDEQIIQILLTFWHEQRHYLDHILTNFGASRVRFYRQFCLQNEFFLESFRKKNVGIPLDAFCDEVEIEALNLSQELRGLLSGIPDMIRNRRDMLDQDFELGKMILSDFPINGYCILEALGAISQMSALTTLFGKDAIKNQKTLSRSYKKYPYFMAVTSVMEKFGIKVLEEFKSDGGDNFGIFHSHILIAVLISSLMCGRFGGWESAESSLLPSSKFIALLVQLREERISIASSAAEAFHIVDRASKKIWGKSNLEFLEDDLGFEHKALEKYTAHLGEDNVKFFTQYHRCRLEIKDLFKNNPENFSDPSLYFSKTVPSIYPKIILANLSGNIMILTNKKLGNPSDREIIWSQDFGNDVFTMKRVYYYSLKDQGEGNVGRARIENSEWSHEIWRARFARFVVQGRKQDLGLELDCAIVERELENIGANVVFTQGYDYPDVDRYIDLAFEIGKFSRQCDISGRPLTQDSAILLSPWDFSRFPELRKYLAKFGKLGICSADGSRSDGAFGNWSPWLVHKDFLAALS